MIEDFVRSYFAALGKGVTGEELAIFYASDVIQEEFPNRLMPNGAKRNLQAILEGAIKGQAVMANQTYEIIRLIVNENSAAVEFLWTGEAKIELGTLKIGDVMKGRFATFIDIRDGKIASQRSYDCFDPF
jgi:ketosteroid isomerase-like protein